MLCALCRNLSGGRTSDLHSDAVFVFERGRLNVRLGAMLALICAIAALLEEANRCKRI